MAHVFISYSKDDVAYVSRMVDELRRQGFDVWIDDRNLHSSEDWWQTIVLSIRSSAAMIVVLTPTSDTSDWVQREITLALKYDKPIYPMWLSGSVDTPNWELFVRTQIHDVRGNKLPDEQFCQSLSRAVPRRETMGQDVTKTVDIAPVDADEDDIYRDAIKNPPRTSPDTDRRVSPLLIVAALVVLAFAALLVGPALSPPPAQDPTPDTVERTAEPTPSDLLGQLNLWRASLTLAPFVRNDRLTTLADEQVSFLYGIAPNDLPNIREHRFEGTSAIEDVVNERGYSGEAVIFVEIAEETAPLTAADIAQILERRWDLDEQGSYTDLGLSLRTNPVTRLQYLVLILGEGA